MTRRTKKVGIVGKYGCRYGTRPRTQARPYLVSKKQVNQCPLCRKYSVKRTVVGVWHCKACQKDFTGGAFTFRTKSYAPLVASVKRLKDIQAGVG
ncbi:MAG: 60S ribosomal protein L43, partial [Paramarteilia canceri]